MYDYIYIYVLKNTTIYTYKVKSWYRLVVKFHPYFPCLQLLLRQPFSISWGLPSALWLKEKTMTCHPSQARPPILAILQLLGTQKRTTATTLTTNSNWVISSPFRLLDTAKLRVVFRTYPSIISHLFQCRKTLGPPAMLYPWFLCPMVPMALARRLDGPATTTTMPRPGAAEVCFEACKAQGFCCNDYNIGSNLVIQWDHVMGGGWGYSTRIDDSNSWLASSILTDVLNIAIMRKEMPINNIWG